MQDSSVGLESGQALLALHRRTERALRLLIRCNQAIVRAASERGLCEAVCAAMVEGGGYKMSWIGMAEHDARKTVRPVAVAGAYQGYLEEAGGVTWADEPRGRGPFGIAIRTGQPALGRDFANDPALAPWREAALSRGFRVSSTFPLIHEEETLGALTVYSAEPEIFDAEELSILGQLSRDVAYGIQMLRGREARTQADRKFEAAFLLSRDAMALVDLERNVIVAANEGFSRLTGYTIAETLGRSPTAFHLLDGAENARADAELKTTGTIRDLLVEQQTKSGEPRSALLSADVVEIGGARHALTTLRDVTAQRKSELSLRRMVAAVEQTPASVVITDAKGAIEYVNPAFERVTGYTQAEALGQNPRILKSGLLSDEVYRELWSAISKGSNWQGRLVNRDKQGKVFTEDAVIAPIRDERGVVCNYVAVKHDVTQELALHERLAQSQKLESLGRLAGGIAHDFNNIIAVILFAVESLQATAEQRPDTVPDLAREIGDAAIRARDLTRQLLAFARKQVFAPVALDLNAALRQSERLLKRLLGADITVKTALDPAAPHVRCDPSQLEQVILNLAVNARDAMLRGGKLTLTTTPLNSGAPAALLYPDLPPGDYVELAVSDTGGGMAPEALARLFEPFFTTKEVGKGTGLGLATVHGIVKQSGGAIRCESELGKGTAFFLCLPRAEPARRASSSPTLQARRERGTEAILLVEDDPHLRRVALRTLEGGGYRVRVAKDGLAALEIATAEQGQLDLVVTDVVMPGLDGGALGEELRIRYPGLPVLFVSGYTDDALGDHGVLREGVEFLPKPFSGAELLARVRAILDARP